MLLSRIALSQTAVIADPDVSSSSQQPRAEFLREAAKYCVTAALKTIKPLRCLQQRQLLCKFSYPDPLYYSTALHVLLLSSRLANPTEKTKQTMWEGILILRQLAEGSKTATSC